MELDEELAQAFAEGRVTRRAFVRQLVDRGMDMPKALSYADALVPPAASAPATAVAEEPRRELPDRPRQADGLDVTVVHDGYVVFDAARDRMHNLNHTAAVVFELCNGQNDTAAIARLVQQTYDLPIPPNEETRQCLSSLFGEGLIT